MIKYAEVLYESIVDGTGIRVVAFLQGCPRACEGCHNPELQPAEGGREMDEERFAEQLLKHVSPLHQGITFSGGDPLMQGEALLSVLKIIKGKRPDLSIWVYTGYRFDQVRDMPVMRYIDVLVDGPFILQQRDLTLAFRGSANQRLIDVPFSLREGRVIEIGPVS
ncbi:MAG: anaerobic ribonucleoside-triphosphate reductase activating protein [Firmicutes bacterium]|nr:anaerobic ribonucleoside-triphosphate reductase activating protein [Bacillota bacterium]